MYGITIEPHSKRIQVSLNSHIKDRLIDMKSAVFLVVVGLLGGSLTEAAAVAQADPAPAACTIMCPMYCVQLPNGEFQCCTVVEDAGGHCHCRCPKIP